MFLIGAVHTTAESEDRSNQNSIASVGATANRIEWHSKVECAGMILTVSGTEMAEFRREFKTGNVPYFEMLDDDGNKFPDGACTYQLQVIPVPIRKVDHDDLPAGRDPGKMAVAKDAADSGQVSEQAMVQFGSFLIEEGHIVTEESSLEIETSSGDIILPANPDFVINDDLIVTGSECLGFDCTSGEPFGSDTLILDVELFKTLGQSSDRNRKKNIEPVDTAAILKWISEVPLSKWSYKSDDDSIVHMGPMAQDFYASFGLGNDDKHITPIDSSGVALAAIQELYKLVAKQNEMIRDLQERNARLEKRLKDG